MFLFFMVVLLTLPDSLSCPLFIYMVMVHFELEFTLYILLFSIIYPD